MVVHLRIPIASLSHDVMILLCSRFVVSPLFHLSKRVRLRNAEYYHVEIYLIRQMVVLSRKYPY